MRKAVVLLLTLGVTCIIVAALIAQSLVILQRVAAVSDVRGFVWVKQRGAAQFVALAGRERVAAGDTLRTGDGASLNLRWLDGTRMRLGPNSVVTILKCQVNSMTKAETSLFRLDLGRVWIRVLKTLSSKSKFEVMTPTATAGVRGTVFSVAVDPAGKTTVSVIEGKVMVRDDHAEEAVVPGKMAQGGQILPQLSRDEHTLWSANRSIAGPNLELREPLAGRVVAPGSLVDVRGVAEMGARVAVNGQEAPVRLQGLFSSSVTAPLKTGSFAIKITARDRRGYVTTEEVKVEVRK